jgi:hypothetical protein
MKRGLFLLALMLCVLCLPSVTLAEDQIRYTSQPDEMVVFLNDIAFVHDEVQLPGGVNVQVVLPSQVFPDTLILRENDERVRSYRVRNIDGQTVVQWDSATDTDLRTVTFEYLMNGIGWQPKYDMWLAGDSVETVDFDFFAEMRNSTLLLDDVEVVLAAARVDTSQQLGEVSTITANQYFAGYEQAATTTGAPTGPIDIQHVYDVGRVTGEPGEVMYVSLTQSELPARRLLLWNAQTDRQVTIIYKVRNESEQPFAEGIVRSYQNNLFIGSDFMELTPVGSEGSITVGNLQNVRVNRRETESAINEGRFDRQYDVELEMTNFSAEAVEIEVVDVWRPNAEEFRFSDEPEREVNNVLRWIVRIEAGATEIIAYQFKVD